MILSPSEYEVPKPSQQKKKRTEESLVSANSKNDSEDSIPEQKPIKKKVNFTPQKKTLEKNQVTLGLDYSSEFIHTVDSSVRNTRSPEMREKKNSDFDEIKLDEDEKEMQQAAQQKPILKQAKSMNINKDAAQIKMQRRMQLSDFRILSVLGQGSYGKVYNVQSKLKLTKNQSQESTDLFALKAIDAQLLERQEKTHEVFIERNVLQHLKHPGIVKLHSTFKERSKLYFLLDKIPNGTLHDFMVRHYTLEEELARFYLAELVNILEYMHFEQIAHRDLKPGNILLNKDFHLVLCDFGTAQVMHPQILKRLPPKTRKQADSFQSRSHLEEPCNERQYSFVGTEEFVSPEVLLDKPSSYSTDFWSLGVILFQMLVGRTPFKGDTQLITFENISKLKFEIPKKLSKNAGDLIKKLLVEDPQERLGAQNFQSIKNHPFFEGINFDTITQQKVPYDRPVSLERKIYFHKGKSACQTVGRLDMSRGFDISSEISSKDSSVFQFNMHSIDESREIQRSKFFKPEKNSEEKIMKKGMLRKKGKIFFNNRLVVLTSKGELHYSDPRTPDIIKNKLNLGQEGVSVRTGGKQGEILEVIQDGKIKYTFKVSFSITLQETLQNTGEIKKWKEEISRFNGQQ